MTHEVVLLRSMYAVALAIRARLMSYRTSRKTSDQVSLCPVVTGSATLRRQRNRLIEADVEDVAKSRPTPHPVSILSPSPLNRLLHLRTSQSVHFLGRLFCRNFVGDLYDFFVGCAVKFLDRNLCLHIASQMPPTKSKTTSPGRDLLKALLLYGLS